MDNLPFIIVKVCYFSSMLVMEIQFNNDISLNKLFS